MTLVLIAITCMLPVAKAMIKQPLAHTHGIHKWHDAVDTIEFTFFIGQEPPLARHWNWRPQTSKITRTIEETAVTINTRSVEKDADTAILNTRPLTARGHC